MSAPEWDEIAREAWTRHDDQEASAQMAHYLQDFDEFLSLAAAAAGEPEAARVRAFVERAKQTLEVDDQLALNLLAERSVDKIENELSTKRDRLRLFTAALWLAYAAGRDVEMRRP